MDIGHITRRQVRDLLRHLSRDRTPGRTSLADSEFVRQSLRRSGFQVTDRARRFEISRLVTLMVEEELCLLRRRNGSSSIACRDDDTARLVEDFSADNRELEAWSAIYFLYLRPDLDISLHDLTSLLHDRHRRTVQRRLQRGVQALTLRLQELEHRALSEARLERVAAHLPGASSSKLIGADSAVSVLARLISDTATSNAVGVGGPGGIGKTEVALAACRKAVAEGRFDSVRWISRTDRCRMELESATKVQECAIGRPMKGHSSESGPDLSDGSDRFLHVVDGLDDLAAAKALVDRVLPHRKSGTLVITGRVGWSGFDNVTSFAVKPLDRDQARELVRREAKERGLADVYSATNCVLEPLIAATSGNPLAIKRAVAQLRVADATQVAADFATGDGSAKRFVAGLWGPIWDRASKDVQAVVLTALALAGRNEFASTSSIRSRCSLGSSEATNALRRAIDAGLLESDGDMTVRRLRPAPFLDRYVKSVGA